MCSTTANVNQRRELYLANPREGQYIGNLEFVTAVGTQAYRGLKLSVTRRSVSGVSINGNYTLSRCFGDEMGAGAPDFGAGFTNPSDPHFDRGSCIADRTHLANLTMSAQAPQFSNALWSAVASNWRVSGIFNGRSGDRLNITTGQDNAFNGQVAGTSFPQRVNQVNDDVHGGTLEQYLKRSAFTQPANGTFGNYERNSLTGPSFWKVDVSFARVFPLRAGHQIEARVEVFNITNHFNWGLPQTSLTSGTFGRITTLGGDMRILQFGIKYGF